ncbi:hypothetical protein VIGAN_08024700 [Vigna angularis var. angularis]|uniref:Replication protein A 14 kDa subunit B n=2 Tax=Phaseolus angularis TaxID=3914 RepID=A0A0S3SLP4_PHAAN|nr:hypothetical protein VIGAN_08024700 [Vigna angularis var. angularis]
METSLFFQNIQPLFPCKQIKHLFKLCFQSLIFPPFSFQAMDTSNPAVFVNAQLIPNFIGKRVRTVVQVNQYGGEVATAKSTDDSQLTIKGLPQVPIMNFIEVIGIAESSNSIDAELWTDFGNTFDTNSFNQLCQLANGEFKGLFL